MASSVPWRPWRRFNLTEGRTWSYPWTLRVGSTWTSIWDKPQFPSLSSGIVNGRTLSVRDSGGACVHVTVETLNARFAPASLTVPEVYALIYIWIFTQSRVVLYCSLGYVVKWLYIIWNSILFIYLFFCYYSKPKHHCVVWKYLQVSWCEISRTISS